MQVRRTQILHPRSTQPWSKSHEPTRGQEREGILQRVRDLEAENQSLRAKLCGGCGGVARPCASGGRPCMSGGAGGPPTAHEGSLLIALANSALAMA